MFSRKLASPCTDCDGLVTGTRSIQDPHQYMVAAAGLTRSPTYLCLLCGTQLFRDREGWQRTGPISAAGSSADSGSYSPRWRPSPQP